MAQDRNEDISVSVTRIGDRLEVGECLVDLAGIARLQSALDAGVSSIRAWLAGQGA